MPQNQTVSVSTRAELNYALQNTNGGTTIQLEPGYYGRVMLTNVNLSQNVTIKSADSSNPAVIGQLIVRNADNLTIDSLHFEYKGFFSKASGNVTSDGAIKYLELLRTDDSSNLVVKDSTFVGATIDVPSGHLYNGYAHGIGWRGMDLENVKFTGNTMTNLWKGMTLVDVEDAEITKNSISDYRSDAIFVNSAKDLTIDGNVMTDVHAYQVKGATGDHADFIQIKNVVNGSIQNNYMDVGSGHTGSQGIFSGYAADMDVSNNIIISRMANGISFSHLVDSNISGNLLLKADSPADGLKWANGEPRKVGGPQIRVNDKFENVVVENNISYDYSLNLGQLVSRGQIKAFNNIQVPNNEVDKGMLAKAGIDLSKFANVSDLVGGSGSNGGQIFDPVTAPGAPPIERGTSENGGAVLHGGRGNDTLRGGEGNDRLYGGTGNDTLFGGNGNDLLNGHGGDDKLTDLRGDNIFNPGGGNDRMEAGAGDDTFLFRASERGDSTVKGFGNGNDQIHLINTRFDDFADVLAAGKNTASGWRLQIDNDTSVTLFDIIEAQLVPENFALL